jgi:hypothetical protein
MSIGLMTYKHCAIQRAYDPARSAPAQVVTRLSINLRAAREWDARRREEQAKSAASGETCAMIEPIWTGSTLTFAATLGEIGTDGFGLQNLGNSVAQPTPDLPKTQAGVDARCVTVEAASRPGRVALLGFATSSFVCIAYCCKWCTEYY